MKGKAIVVPTAPAAVAVSVAQAVDSMMLSKLSFDNITDFLCEIGGAVDSIGKAYHYGMAFLVAEFGRKAVFGINGNRCKSDEAKKKHATELDLDYPDFQRLFAVFEAVNKRRADCWRQAKTCYTNAEKALSEASTVTTVDKPNELVSAEIALEEIKAQIASAKADKKRAELNLAQARLDKNETAELEKIANEARAEFEALEAQRASIAQQLQGAREKAKKDSEWAEYSKRVEGLAKWCKERDDYKDVAKKVLDLLLV